MVRRPHVRACFRGSTLVRKRTNIASQPLCICSHTEAYVSITAPPNSSAYVTIQREACHLSRLPTALHMYLYIYTHPIYISIYLSIYYTYNIYLYTKMYVCIIGEQCLPHTHVIRMPQYLCRAYWRAAPPTRSE
jgi:hypothetical protein